MLTVGKQNSNLISFRINEAALYALEQSLPEGKSLSTYCQEILYNAIGIESPEILTKVGFEPIVNSIVNSRLADMQAQIDAIQDKVDKPKSTRRKPTVNTES